MKFSFLLLFIILFKIISAAIDFKHSVCDDKNTHDGYWICDKNPDNTYNVTFDCSIQSNNKTTSVWIWSPKFPEDMNSLTIQNCENLKLFNGFQGAHVMIEYRYLYVRNISEMVFSGDSSNLEQDQYYHNEGNGKTVHSAGEISLTCLPANNFFENITKADFQSYPVYDNNCVSKGVTLKTLQLSKINIDVLEDTFLNDPMSLKELKMMDVRIVQVKKELRPSVITVSNKKALIKIRNCTIEEMPALFMQADVGKVIISNTNIKTLGQETRRSYDDKTINALSIKAEKLIFNGNSIERLLNSAFDISSNDIEMTNNIFKHVDEDVFRSLSPQQTENNLIIHKTTRFFNFSNNIIYSLTPGALTIDSTGKDVNSLFDKVSLFNNSINCTCGNMHWFDNIAKNHDIKYYLNYKWSKLNNQNKCFNIPDCYIAQVLNNYQELCEDDFHCYKMSFINTSYGNVQQIERVLRLVNYNNEVGQKTSKLLEVLLRQMESEEIFRNAEEEDKNEDLENFQALIGDALDVEDNWIRRFSLNLNKISSCLLIVTCLSCMLFAYIVFVKCLGFPFCKKVTSKFSGKVEYSETEMATTSMSNLR